MTRPDQVQALLVHSNQRQAHQGGTRQVEAFGSLFGCQRLQGVAGHLTPTPVEHAQRQTGLTLHHLQGLRPPGR